MMGTLKNRGDIVPSVRHFRDRCTTVYVGVYLGGELSKFFSCLETTPTKKSLNSPIIWRKLL